MLCATFRYIAVNCADNILAMFVALALSRKLFNAVLLAARAPVKS